MFNIGQQEYSARTLGATWGIIGAVMVPIMIVLICIGWRLLLRRKREERDEQDFMTIKSRPIDPDESMKINSDDESIPYKKDLPDDSPEPTDPVQIVDSSDVTGYPYSQPYPPEQQMNLMSIPESQQLPHQLSENPAQRPGNQQDRRWDGETEIN